ncbi:MAG: tRNA uridine-5-carboxymethylaminomethyl(34) synthesis enzyme MnmG [Spartobacteria bacterium]|nr:tRNA uridine-5-carboxymethylaminomethyl(34) synthesis enzyme MnmG [Spartobacteria bacterium]
MTTDTYEIIVVGGGHAGYEAALAAARMGAETALVTIQKDTIGRMSCNPSIGGIAKSHIVCEIDALGGEQGRLTDYTGIQFRTLNTRKGPAVQATRAQCDKNAFPARIQAVIDQTPHLTVIEALTTEILVKNGVFEGILTKNGQKIMGKAMILTPGTFLNGEIFIGMQKIPAGRFDEAPATALSHSLRKIGFTLARLKTGTPPRVHIESLDYKKMEIQPGFEPPPFFSRAAKNEWKMFHVEHQAPDDAWLRRMFHVEHVSPAMRPWKPGTDQIPCYLTHTTSETHAIIRENLEKSALYGGAITGTGVRYCPSIEDKIVKFASRDAHHVFIEPEGRNNDRIYPNGTSNSLPEEVQLKMIHSIPGMEKAVFIRPGYGIEYDFSDPTQLFHTLETKLVENLYFAGQINGTTGYEEAAGQGLVAGVNAVLKLRGEKPFILQRSESYIGVLIDDLVTKGTDEPYRMFTSRAEYRLLLRQGNAAYRMFPHARRLGILHEEVQAEIQEEMRLIDREIERLDVQMEQGVSLSKKLRRPEITYPQLHGAMESLDPGLIEEIEVRVKYEGYIRRELEQIARAGKNESVGIPPDFDYDAVRALRFEAREKLKHIRPENLGQAARISGVNPADISILSIWLKKSRNALP